MLGTARARIVASTPTINCEITTAINTAQGFEDEAIISPIVGYTYEA